MSAARKDDLTYIDKIVKRICDDMNLEDIEIHLNSFSMLVKNVGLDEEHVKKMVDLALRRSLPLSEADVIINSLIPRYFVPWEAVVSAVSWIGTKCVPFKLKKKILTWIVAIYNTINDISPLHALYDVIFNYLDDPSLSPIVAHLICLLTQKNDVKSYRVKKIRSLYESMGKAVHICGLLHAYKLNYPEMITFDFDEYETYFKQVDPFWTAAVQDFEIRTLNVDYVDAIPSCWPKSSENRKKRLTDPQHDSQLSYFPADVSNELQKSIEKTVTELNGLNLPNFRRTNYFDDRVLALFISSACRDQDIRWRTDASIKKSFIETFLIRKNDVRFDAIRYQLINSVVQFEEYMQEGLPSTLTFLKTYLKQWTGDKYLLSVMRLISWIPICPNLELKDFILEPLRKIFITSTCHTQILLFQGLTELLRNYCQMELNTKSLSPNCFFTLDAQSYATRLASIKTLIEFVNDLCEHELSFEKADHSFLHAATTFYELIVELYPRYKIPILMLPSDSFVQTCLVSTNIVPISRLCSMFCRWKKVFAALKAHKEPLKEEEEMIEKSLKQIKNCNSHLLTVCNSLFRDRAFKLRSHESDDGSFNLSFDMNKTLQSRRKQCALNFYSHVAILSFSWNFFKEIRKQLRAEGFHLVFTKEQTKQLYMNFLRENKLKNITDFFDDFIRRKSS